MDNGIRIRVTDQYYRSGLWAQITDSDNGSGFFINTVLSNDVLKIELYLPYSYADNFSRDNIKKINSDLLPEDHPNYGEEWKLFWKKRYNELIQECFVY